MINSHHCYIILTAKKQSNRFPGKLWKDCHGRKLIYWAATECHEVNYIDNIFLCSDFFVDWSRFDLITEPDFLLNKSIMTVLKYAISTKSFENNDYIIWVDLCNPFVKKQQIEKVIEAADRNNLDSCFITKKQRYNIRGKTEQFYTNWSVRLRTVKTILEATDEWSYGKRHGHLPIAKDYEISIDYPYDLIMAEALMKNGY